MSFNFQEDMHVHSQFSDGAGTVEENIQMAQERGLQRICCVDHVRRKTPWVQDFAQAIKQARTHTPLEVLCGVEAKILNEHGELDVPDDLTGVDFIYAADHRFPMGDRCWSPGSIQRMRSEGKFTAKDLIEMLVSATCNAMLRYDRVVVAHLFSILPKIGIHESQVPQSALEQLAKTAAKTNSSIEIDERWACPSPRSVQPFLYYGVPVLMSTDSHKPETIGQYDFNRKVARELAIDG